MNRHGVFYWRRRVPRDIAQTLACNHLTVSLKTRERSVARPIARALSKRLDQYVRALRQERKTPAVEELRLVINDLKTSAHLARRWSGEGKQHNSQGRGAFAHSSQDFSIKGSKGRVGTLHHRDALLELRGRVESVHRYLMEDWFGPLLGILDQILDADEHEAQHTQIAAEKRPPELNTASSEAWPASGNRFAGPLLVPGKPLSTYIESFIGEKKKGRRESTRYQARVSLNLLVKILEDRPVGSIKRADAKKLHDVLESLPSCHGRSIHDRKRSVAAVIAARGRGAKGLRRATLNRHWASIREFFDWLNVQDETPETDLKRVFGGFQWAATVPQEQPRQLWDVVSIERLLGSPIWTGFKPHPRKRYWRHEQGEVVVKDEYWWLPILALYHGAREEELCRLRGSDVFQSSDGIHVMWFHGDHLKNRASVREVPIHSAVIRLGFLDLAQVAGNRLLFLALRELGRDQKLSYRYSREFTAYRKRIGVYRPGMDFHSFRHLVTTKLIGEGRRSILEADEITGHDSLHRKEVRENQSESLRYFQGHKIRVLKEAIETIAYPQIDIQRLAALSTETTDAQHWLRIWQLNRRTSGRRSK